PAGDAVLRTLVQRGFGMLRDNDMLGRIGGEEFAVLLPSTDAIGAAELAERLRTAFLDTPVMVNASPQRVTASFGICGLNAELADVDAWMAAADKLLYEAKAGGRNQCVSNADPKITL
ncbi:MAG: diguanylate cyclase, partial [Cypionkella sp.]|uniref:GGDEF domain-containing protein n=1 Tax=Cypionkella sp. TaxID=2811411 RepID=UPI00260AB6D1